MPTLPSLPRLPNADGTHRERTLLYIGRIHPKKGISNLVPAWAAVAPDFPNWHLRIIGPGEKRHLHELALIAATLPRLSIEPAVYGEAKWRAFAEADLFILPSHNENFGITVAESLACGRPVITTKGTPWKDVETHKCGWWVDNGPTSIEAALRVALSRPVEVLDEMGERGAAWIKSAFSWDRVGEEMAQVYRWLCVGVVKPDWIVLD
jgi:glycosyltransferase involved in cell wall biosynthesis